MRYFKSPDGQAVNGILDAESAAIAALLAAGWLEVPCMHPGAQEIVWKRPNGTISVTTVLPETLAQMERAHGLLALDRQAAVEAVPVAESALAASVAALDDASRASAAGTQASKLRLQVRAQVEGIREQATRQLAELQREAFAYAQGAEQRDAELGALERAGVQAQAELAKQQAREQAAAVAAVEAQTDIDAASATIAQADQALATLQVALAAGTAGETAAADMAAALASRQAADTVLASARTRLAEAERQIADAGAVMGNLQQVISQAKQATAERLILGDARRDRATQDDAAAAALRTAADQAVATLQQNDTQLAALELAAVKAENGMQALQASHEAQKAALASAQQLVSDIEWAERIAATIGTTLAEHAQLLQVGGGVPADWVLAAIYPAEASWKPDWPVQDDMVWDDVTGAVAVDIARARETTRQRLRAERTPLLAQLDIQSMRNLESGADNSAVVAEKVRLRDITLQADACRTLADLKALKC
jgi:hypothetical protein